MRQTIKIALLSMFLLLFAGGINALAQSIKGKVTDVRGHGIPGVTVFFKGTENGTITDDTGSYTITKRGASNVLVFSCMGLKEQERSVTNRAVINVTMEEEVNYLDEAVSIGYQEVKRKDLLGSVVSVDNKSITSLPATNFAEALAGKMAGVSVTTNEGDPGASVSIKVRGTASITQDGSPLYIVDGYPVSSIADLSPQDIKSVDVLKDAFSTAIYGSRGAYGVVLITTKDAASGKVSLTYDGYFGFKTFANKDAVQVMDPYDYARYNYEYSMGYYRGYAKDANYRYSHYFGDYQDIDLYKSYPGNDWLGKVFDNVGKTQNHSVQLSGSSSMVRWTANYSHMQEDAIMIGSNYKRDNLSFRSYFFPVKQLAFYFGARFSDTRVRGAGANSINDKGTTYSNGRMMNALRYTPIPIHYTDEDLGDAGDAVQYFGPNPVEDVRDNDTDVDRINYNITGSATWTIIPNLKLKVEGGMDNNNAITNRFYGLMSYYTRFNADPQGLPNSNYTDQKDRTIRNVNTLSYNFKDVFKNNRHALDMLLGEEYSASTSNTETVVATGFPASYTAEMTRLYRGAASRIPSSTNQFYETNVMLSFFGRVNYVYDKRYSVSAAIRADASSKFAPQNRWGVFPSAAVSWDISNESFMRGIRNIDQLKLRYSFGTAGNNRIPSGSLRTTFFTEQNSRIFEMPNMILPSTTMPNENLKWETTYSHNLGLDFAFFHAKLSGSAELYHNTTKDLLINYPVSGTGYNTQYQNLGSVLNRGVEFTLRSVIVEKRNFGLNVSANIALNQNRVLSLGDLPSIETNAAVAYGIYPDFIVMKDKPLGTMYGLVSDGLYSVDEFTPRIVGDQVFWDAKPGTLLCDGVVNGKWFAPGAPKFVDQNGDGTITADDRVELGSTLPIGTGGFSINANCYGFDLSAAFNYSFGGKVYNADRLLLTQRGQWDYRNNSVESAPGNGRAWTNIDWETGAYLSDPDRLAEVNKDATMFPAYTVQNFFSDMYIEDGSFLRLASLTLGYTLPQSFTQRFYVQRLRVYVTGSNLFCLTKYSGFDPEVNCKRSTPLTPGVDASAYPKSRGIIFGVNITL